MRVFRHAWNRFAAVGAAGVLLWGAVPATAWADSGAPPTSEVERALDQAQSSGQRVEVVGERTESTTTYANPDGMTLTLDQSTTPVRVKEADGSWAAPDATLHQLADGSVAPAAAVVDLRFSGGGSAQPLVSIARGGRSFALTWPGSLPVPVLDGDSAVYPDVFPDVDLRLTASVEGYREVLVVKSPAAAADARVKKVRFGMHSDGLTVRSTAGGGLSAVGPDGQEVFTSPPAQVWDSTGTEQPAAVGPQPEAAKAARAAAADATAPDEADAAAGPAPGANVATAPVAVEGDSLTLAPDKDVLATTDAAAYPLFIDPDVSLNSGAPTRTLLRSDGYTSYGWGNGDDEEGVGDGHCGTWGGYTCGPGYTQRLYFQFSPTALKGKKVLKATFRVTSTWAFQCEGRITDLERTNNISSSTKWSTRPAELDLMVDRTFSAGRGSKCSPDSPAATIEFTDSSAESNENLTPTVANFAAGKFSALTLELRAHDETDTSAWKRFKNNAVLSVNFVANPALPTSVGIVSGSSPVCHTSASDPQIVSDPTPLVSGRPQTAAGGESGARLRVRWRVDKLTNGVWGTAFTDITRPTSGFVGDNVVQTASLPTLTDGVSYRLKALTLSYQDNQTTFVNTGYTTPCYFVVDSTAPKAPGITFGSTYTECLPTACVAGGGPGAPGTAQFTAASGDTLTHFEYKLSSSDTWTVVNAADAASVTIAPQVPGTYHLEVRGQDSLGRWGAETVKDFLVAAGQGPVGQWHFDEASGPALDTSTTVAAQQHNATLSTGAVRDDRGRRGDLPDGAGGTTPDKGLSLDGTSGYAATAGPVLETRSAYTVSAWVKLDSLTATGVVLSQDGQTYSPFVLSYDVGQGTWIFGVKEQDANNGHAYYGVVAGTPAKTGVWTHLLGSYDPVSGHCTLYVNGIAQGTSTVSGSWSATGPFQIGRYKWGTYQYDFPGSIDEVKVWQRTLTAGEAATEARMLDDQGNQQVELVGSWQPAGQTGTAVADTTSGYGRSLDLSGGASLTDDGLVLDGTDDAATATGQLVDDAGSFTVTAGVALNSTVLAGKPDGYTAQIVGQRTASGSSWGLWFELVDHQSSPPLGLWHFGRLGSDGTFTGVTSNEAAEIDTPVQITGVFDAQSGVVRLYVGEVQNGDDQAFAPVTGSGDLAVGKGPDGTGWAHYLPGTVSDIRVWAGAMTGVAQIESTVGG